MYSNSNPRKDTQVLCLSATSESRPRTTFAAAAAELQATNDRRLPTASLHVLAGHTHTRPTPAERKSRTRRLVTPPSSPPTPPRIVRDSTAAHRPAPHPPAKELETNELDRKELDAADTAALLLRPPSTHPHARSAPRLPRLACHAGPTHRNWARAPTPLHVATRIRALRERARHATRRSTTGLDTAGRLTPAPVTSTDSTRDTRGLHATRTRAHPRRPEVVEC
ncbi:hypothetical protein B0H17DRAFT_1190246 [Mycena rosella]|uniref:Uncharacterized protein n=1 Tax=Mycena rosella TaxID=1033263 RepID=A0AAD7MCC4_MYCRO|nr:hypothetical protein B0H17DRAFT_1190246 [Mycena rosella]